MIQPLTQAVPENGTYMIMADFVTPYGVTPAGFEIDGASIPWWGWHLTYTPFDPVVIGAAAWHDYGCLVGCYDWDTLAKQFHDICMMNGANGFKAHLMLSALQSVEWMYWRNAKELEKKLHYMYQMCRGRIEFPAYKFPAWIQHVRGSV